MALSIRHTIGGKAVNPPLNQDEVNIGFVNHISRVERTNNTQQFTWVDNEAAIIASHLDAGKLFEKLQHLIEISDGANKFTFDRYIDISNATFDRNRVDADSVVFKDIEWLNSVAVGISFERLYDEGTITDSDFIQLPYTLSSVPNYKEGFIVFLSGVVIAVQIRDAAEELKAVLSEFAAIFDSIGAFLRVVTRIFFFVTLVLTMVDLTLQLFELMTQRVKYTPSMGINQMLRIALDTLGLKLNSFISDDVVIAPKQFQVPENPQDNRIKGVFFPNANPLRGFFPGTLADLIRKVTDLYYARLQIIGDTVHLTPYNFVPQTATFTVPPVDQHIKRINAKSLTKYLNLSFSYDLRDDNTITNWKGTNVEVTFEPAGGAQKGFNPLSDSGIVKQFEFALATRKEKLSLPEQILVDVAPVIDGVLNALIIGTNAIFDAVEEISEFLEDIVNPVIRFFGGDSADIATTFPEIPRVRIGELIEDRVGMMQLQNDEFTVDKIIHIRRGSTPRQTKALRDEITAKKIYQDHWKGVNAQIQELPLSKIDQNLLNVLTIENELAARYRGKVCRVKANDWNGNLTGGLAEMTLELFEDYVNLTEEITEPDGN